MPWEDAPKHVCRRKTAAGLVFCCPKTKNCPARDTCLTDLGISNEDYRKIKKSFESEFDKNSDINVCFGSLTWCCKPSRTCQKRDNAIQKLNMTHFDYMKLKKKMALEFENVNDN